jgi:hypothetical protein
MYLQAGAGAKHTLVLLALAMLFRVVNGSDLAVCALVGGGGGGGRGGIYNRPMVSYRLCRGLGSVPWKRAGSIGGDRRG